MCGSQMLLWNKGLAPLKGIPNLSSYTIIYEKWKQEKHVRSVLQNYWFIRIETDQATGGGNVHISLINNLVHICHVLFMFSVSVCTYIMPL